MPKKRHTGAKTQKVQTARRPVGPSARLQLRYLAHARSGDKGDTANVGLIALEPEYYPILRKEVTRARVARHFRGMSTGVERFAREIAPLVLTGPPSVTGFAGGRPDVQEIVAYWPALIDRREIEPFVRTEVIDA